MNEATELITNPLFSGNYMPHGMCYAWEPSILWISIASDLLIASSYFSIPIAILIFVKKRQVSNYRHIYMLFAAFIFFCGVTHLFSILTIFKGYYGYQALLKLATAIVSFITAVGVFKYLPLAFTLPSPSELVAEQKAKVENEIFKQISFNSPIGFILVNEKFHVEHMNPKACQLFGYTNAEAMTLPVNALVSGIGGDMHTTLMEQYVNTPSDAYRMNAGRTVNAITKTGDKLSIEVTISTGHYQNEKYIFVSVIDREESIRSDNLLRNSLMKFDRIIEATEDGLWEWDIVSDNVWQSKKHLVLMGYEENTEPSFKLWVDHIHPDEKKRVLEELDNSLLNKNDFNIEYLGKTNNGDYEWFRSKGRFTLNSNGEPVLLSGNLVNIHNDVIQKSELISNSEHLEKVISRSINCLYVYDYPAYKYTYVNDEYTKITGYTLQDLLDKSSEDKFLELYHPEDMAIVNSHLKKLQESKEGDLHSIQYRIKHKDGSWIWILSRDSIFSFNKDGTPKEILGTFIDITQIKEYEDIQNKLLIDFQNTFEVAAVGVAHVGLDGSWIKVNNKVCSILGYSREELLNRSFQELTYPDDLELDLSHVADLIQGRSDSYAMEKRYVKSNGEVFWANLTVSIVREGSGEPDYFISVIEDISHRKEIEQDQKRLNEELKVTNDQLTRFAYSASHDMQEPLRKITSFSTSLLSRLGEKDLDKKSKFELERISSASRRMKSMIQRLLDLSRTSSVKLDLSEVSTEELINDAKDQLSVICKEFNVKIMIEGVGVILCDRLIISNVIENLIRNSIKYKSIDRDPIIKINTYEEDNYSVISFKDNGMGFDNRFRHEIFDPFKRLVNHSEIPGSGMGLAICKQLISQHNGDIEAVGVEGEGATFTIKFPKRNKNNA